MRRGDNLKEKRTVTVDGREFEVELELKESNWEVIVEGKTYSIQTDSRSKPKRKKTRTVRSSAGSGTVSSPIPGKVVSIHVSEGDDVKSGDVIVVLEAMKMQNEIKATVGGEVKKINCSAGQRVEANVPLIEIERNEGD